MRKRKKKMGGFVEVVKSLGERHPPIAPQRGFLARMAKCAWKESAPTIGLQKSVFWTDVGAKSLSSLSADSKRAATGKSLLDLMKTHRYSSLTSLGAMFERLTALKDDVDAAETDPQFVTARNLYLAYCITQNELEENYLANLWLRGFFLGVREGWLAKQYGDRIGVGQMHSGYAKEGDLSNDDLVDLIEEKTGRRIIIGMAGNVSAAKEMLEALAITELSGSEAEKGKFGAKAHLWKDRGTVAMGRLRDFLSMPPSRDFVDTGSGLPVITGQGLQYILENVVNNENSKHQFDIVEMLGVQFLRLDDLMDVKKAVEDSLFLNAFRIYLALRALQHYTTEFYLISLGEFGKALVFDTWRLVSKYVKSYLDMSKFVKETHNKGSAFESKHMQYFGKKPTIA